jgi:hypothetical protein
MHRKVERPFSHLAASEALQRIAALYRVESGIRGRSADERRTVR